jgi:serine phosphatase RsbU (regulator of sigma subunit)
MCALPTYNRLFAMDQPAATDNPLPATATSATFKLTDFLDISTLQEIQDSFAAVAHVEATITDADGNVLTQSEPTRQFVARQRAIEQTDAQLEGRDYVAPIIVNRQRLGTIRMKPSSSSEPASIQFVTLLANAIARLCYQEFQLRQRINELTAVYNVTMMLSEARDLPSVLLRTAQVVAEVMGVKASSIRLLDKDDDQLVIRAVHNLSQQYLNKGPIRLSAAQIDQVALGPQGYEYVRSVATDPRTLYPEEATREGIVSALSVGMRYKGKLVGVLRVYTGVEIEFSKLQIDLLKAIAAQAAAAIENARLLQESLEAEALERQVQMASDVQHRMMPSEPPRLPGLDLASVYVPCFALGGDFYDFIELPYHNVGLTIADVSGKGVPASLIMASVRAALRAQVDNVYYVYEIMQRVNMMLCRDTKPTEFVTLLYGVLDVPNKRLTYCNAGHPPGLLLRNGKVTELNVNNMVLGVTIEEQYSQSTLDLKPGDTLLFYTDGLSDAANFNKERFGRERIIEAFKQGGATADIIAQNVLWNARRFVGLTERNDDITMIVARIG